MGKRVVAIVIIILIIGGAVYGLTRSKNNNDNNSTTNQTNNSQNSQNNQPQSNQSSQAPTSTNAVTIQNFAFSPGDITVKKGTTVTWTNKDTTAHTVSEMDSQKGPDSGDLNPGGTYSFRFDQTGTFKYRCNIHTYMLGTVTVTD